MDNVTYSKEIRIRHSVDVFVAGGGPAGVTAAIAAAREGASVFLAESSCCFGGMGTIGMVPAFMQISDGINLLCDGLGKEIIDKSNEYKNDKNCGFLSINKEALKRAYDDMVTEAGVDFRFMTQVIDVNASDGKINYVVLSSKSGIYAVKAKIYIDCTGDGDICAMAGAEFVKGDENGVIMPATLCSLWVNVDWDSVPKIPHNSFIEQAYKEKVLSVEDRHIPGIWKVGKNIGGGNVGHAYGVDNTDEATVTDAMVEQRKLLVEYEAYYNKYIKGFENSKIVSTAEMLGIRATRRIIGEYVLNIEDFKSRAVFEDEIGRYSYPVDIHPAKPSKDQYEKFEKEHFKDFRYDTGESYGIPYRILVPKGLDNAYVAGRCVSTDNYMQASIRVMPGCYILGQAAGTAAAIAVCDNADNKSLNVRRLQQTLKNNKAYLPNFK